MRPNHVGPFGRAKKFLLSYYKVSWETMEKFSAGKLKFNSILSGNLIYFLTLGLVTYVQDPTLVFGQRQSTYH